MNKICDDLRASNLKIEKNYKMSIDGMKKIIYYYKKILRKKFGDISLFN